MHPSANMHYSSIYMIHYLNRIKVVMDSSPLLMKYDAQPAVLARSASCILMAGNTVSSYRSHLYI